MKGLTGMGFSAVALIAGAIMYFAVTTHGNGFKMCIRDSGIRVLAA